MLNFEPIHYLTDEQMWAYWNEPDATGATILLHVCEQSAPGVAMSLPIWGGSQLAKLDDGDVIERIPDQSRMDDFGQLIYRGNNLTESAITELVVDLIVRQQIEVPLAFAWRFSAANFAEHAELLEGMRKSFWSDLSVLTKRQQSEIDARLHAESLPYRILCDFFSSPRQRKFRGLVESVISDRSLAGVYALAAE